MTRTARVLYVGGGVDRRERVATLLGAADGVSVETEPDRERAIERLDGRTFDCVLAHETWADGDGRSLPESVRAADPDVAVAVLTDREPDGGSPPGAVDELIPEWALAEGADPLAARIRSVVESARGAARVAELVRPGIGADDRWSGAVVGILDEDGRFDHVPTAADRVPGYGPDDLAGRPVTDVVHPGDREEVGAALETLAETPGRPLVAEFRVGSVDGGWLWVEARSMSRADGTPSVVVQARDGAASASETRLLEAMVKHSSDVITVLDGDGTIRYESPAARRVKGVDPAAVVGRSAFEFVHPEDHDRIREALSTIAGQPGAVTDPVEYRIRDDDGEWRWLESVGSNPGPDAPVDGYVVNTRNVTERVERERQLRVLDRVLRHDVRNHLDVIMGYAERVGGPGEVDVELACRRVLEDSEELLATVEKERAIVQLLTDPPERTRVDCPAAVRAAVEDVREAFPDAAVDLTCPPEAPVEAIPELRRAVTELVENAVEHGGGSATVTVRPHDGTVVVSVADEGPRIADDELAVLLDARGIDQLHHGSGMGLWLVHWIVRRSGGDLAFEPGDPTGNVVTLTFAAARDDRHGASGDPDRTHERSGDHDRTHERSGDHDRNHEASGDPPATPD